MIITLYIYKANWGVLIDLQTKWAASRKFVLTRDLIGKNIFTDCPPGKVLPDFCGSSGESLWGSGEAGADPQPFAAALWGWAEPRSPVLPCWGKLVLCSRPGAQIQLGHCCCHPTAPGLCTALQALWFLPNGEQQKGSEEKTSEFSLRDGQHLGG